MKDRYKNIKLLLKQKILQEQNDYKILSDKTLSEEQLTDKFEKLNSWRSIEEFFEERRKENRRNSATHWFFSHTPEPLEKELRFLIEDVRRLDAELFRDGTSKNSYKDLFEDFEAGIKKVLGNDLKDWKNRIAEVGYKDKEIADLQNKNEKLSEELQEEEEKVDIRNNRAIAAKEIIDHLKEEVAEQIKQREKWKTEYYREKKRVIYHVLKLAEDQAEIKKLKESETKLEKKQKKLEQIIQEKEKQELKSAAESKRVPLSLIKSENITNSLLSESDNSLLSAIENTNNLLIDTVAKTQQYLKVDDLTLIATSHPLPEGKSLADLINFYNNPPLCQNPQHVNCNAPSPKSDHQPPPLVEIRPLISAPAHNPVGPIIKKVFKDNPEQISEITRLNQDIQKLEEELRKRKGEIISKDKMVMERFILYLLLFLLLTIVLASTSKHALKKKKKKR